MSFTFPINFNPYIFQNWTLSTKGRFLAPQKINQVPVEVLQVLDSFITKINKDSKNPFSSQFAFPNFPLLGNSEPLMALLGGFLWEGKKQEGQLFSFPGVLRAPLPFLGVAGGKLLIEESQI